MPSAASMRVTPSGSATASSAAAAASAVEPHPAAEEVVGIQVAEDEVGVGHGRLDAAAAVAGRPGVGARRARPDLQHAGVVHPGDRAAAGADRRHLHLRAAELVLVDDRGALDLRPPAVDDADVERGAADVGADQLRPAGQPAQEDRAHDAADRPGVQRGDRVAAGLGGRRQTARGLHHQQRVAVAAVAQPRPRARSGTRSIGGPR